MAGVIQFITQQVQTNQFMAAALVAGPASVLAYSARTAPAAMWRGLKRVTTMELRLNSDTHEYHRALQFVTERVAVPRWSRTFKYHGEAAWGPGDSEPRVKTGVSLGYGAHYGWWRGRPVWIERTTTENSASDRFKETLQITFMGRQLATVREFAQALGEYLEAEDCERSTTLYINDSEQWTRLTKTPARTLSTVFTSNGQGAAALRHITQFEAHRQWHRARGLPHHTGIILVGPPGTGKSSLIQALAGETGRDLRYLNLGAVTEENQLSGLMSDRANWQRSMLVLEDLDVSGAAVQRQGRGTVTLSTLLNLLDGPLSPDGVVFVATTNHPESLDPALLRAGRFDLRLSLGPLEWPQFEAMARLFQLDSATLAAVQPAYQPTPGSTARALLMAGPAALRAHYA